MPEYRDGWGAEFFAKRAAEVDHGGQAILKGFEISAEASRKVLRLLEYRNISRESSFRDDSRLMHSTFEGEEASKEEMNQTLWSQIIIEGDERRDKRESDAENVQYTLRHKLLLEHL